VSNQLVSTSEASADALERLRIEILLPNDLFQRRPMELCELCSRQDLAPDGIREDRKDGETQHATPCNGPMKHGIYLLAAVRIRPETRANNPFFAVWITESRGSLQQ